MINRIRRVRNYRGLQNWSPSADLPAFGEINLIYGVNGSGKSTIASLLQDAHSDTLWQSGMEIDTTDGSGAALRVSKASDHIWQTFRVFNADYVAQNLSFEEEAGGSAQPLLVLGKENVERDAQRKDAESRIAAVDAKLPSVRAGVTKAMKTRNDLLTRQARTIASELSSVGGRYAERSYDAATLRKELQGPSNDPPDGLDIATEISLVQEQPLPELGVPTPSKISVGEIAERVATGLRATVTSKALEELVDHPDWQNWVEAGLALHEHRDACIYCQGSIAPDRQVQLSAHFDASLRNLEKLVAGLRLELASAKTAADELIRDLPRGTEFAGSGDRRNDLSQSF